MSNGQLAFLGGGNMGRALIGGLLRRGTRPEHISVGESFAAAREALAAQTGGGRSPAWESDSDCPTRRSGESV